MADDLVFMMTRHVNSEVTNKYWIESCGRIRKLWPDVKIVVIDDNSNYDYVTTCAEKENIEIVQSEYPGRGELLPYYYFYKNKYGKKAVIIHDSLFIIKEFNLDIHNVKFISTVPHYWDSPEHEIKMIIDSNMENSAELINFYNENKEKWALSFGVMSIITYEFLEILEIKYKFFNLLGVVKNRFDRICLERIFGLICHYEYPELIYDNNIILNLNYYTDINTFDAYINAINMYGYDLNNIDRPFIKVFTGR